MDDNKFLIAIALIVAGLVLGVVLGGLVRRVLSRREQKAIVDVAAPAASLVFWTCVAGGLILAVAVVAPSTLEPIPERIVAFVPTVLVAGLMLIVGQALGGFVSAAVGQGLERATGKRQLTIERVIKSSLLGLGMLLALAQLGLDTSIIQLLLAGLVGSLSLTFALLAGLGGREVASNIAAGRSMRAAVAPGVHISVPGAEDAGIEGVVTDVGPVSVTVSSISGDTIHVPFTTLLSGPVRMTPEIVER